jgi:type IV secretion system protein VirB4
MAPRAKKRSFILRESHVADRLPYTRHITGSVVGMRSGRMLAVLELEGAAFETADRAELNGLHDRLNLLWRNVNDERLAVWTHVIRTRDRFYPDGEFRSEFARRLDEKYKARLAGEALYKNRLFAALVFAPARKDRAASLAARLRAARRSGQELERRALDAFEGVVAAVAAGLGRYGARLLTLYGRNGLAFSEPMEYLNAIGCGSFEPLPLVDGPIGGALLPGRPLFGRETIELRGAGSSRYAGALGVKEYPAMTRPGMLDDLLRAPFEFVLSQSFAMTSKTDGRAILSLKEAQLVNAGDRALSQIDDLGQALDDLESNRFTMGRHHLSLTAFASSPQALLDVMALARRIMSDCGVVTAREDLALEAAWWGQWPGNFRFRPRSGHISSRNFAALSPFHSYPQGRPECAWGPSVALLKTSSGCAFHFNLHAGDLGNAFICGPSGSGKTVLQNFLLAQLQKHGAAMVFFDKDRGAELFVRAAGGTYLALRNGRPTGCAPLKALDLDDPSQRDFAVKWAAKLVQQPERPLTVTEQREIESGVLQLRRLPQNQRTIGALRAFLGQSDPEGAGARLERWTGAGPLGWVFDNGGDELALDAQFMGFDMTDFLDNAEVRTPLMMYLFHRIERLIDGRRVVIDIDEFWKALGDEAFRDLAQNKLKTIRKQNGLMIFGTQSPRDAIRSPIGYTIVEQCPTKIFMPNAAASAEDYIEGFGLSRREFELVKHELSTESRQFLVKQEHDSVVAGLDLRGFRDELVILSGRTAAVNRLDEIRARVGDDFAAWGPILLNEQEAAA